MELWTAYFIIFPGSVTNTKNIPKTGQAIPIAHNKMHFVFEVLAMLVGHLSFAPTSIHFPPHSSSEIKQQRVLHPISQQHKTFSPSKPSLHPELPLSEVLCCVVRVALTLSCLALHRTSSIVHGCSVHECIVHGCIVHECSIHRCIVKCTMYTDASYTDTSYTDALYMEASLNQT